MNPPRAPLPAAAAAAVSTILLACAAAPPGERGRVRLARQQPAGGAAATPAARLPRDGEVVRIDEELVARRIAPDAYVVTHEPFHASNVLVVRAPDGTAVLCSSPFETQAARALVRWVRSALRPPRIVAINTHFHLDGTGGNAAYRELGVETWGTALTRALLLDRGPALRAAAANDFDGARRARVLATELVPAEHTFAAGSVHTFSFGGAEVRVMEPGPAHAPDNLLVFFPSIGVLFGGCMIKSSRSIGFIGHADLEHWEAAVDVARRTGAQRVVPGHGPTGGPELFELTVEVVRAARASRDAAR